MKSTTIKFIILGIVIATILSILQMPVLASTDANDLLIKKDKDVYLIYTKNVLNSKFEFAFSNEKTETSLNYISSVKDSQGNNVAYIDSELEDLFFSSEKDTYIWIKANNKIVLEGVKLELNTAKIDEKLAVIKNVTNKINVNSDTTEEKIKINGDNNKKYYYKISAVNSSEDYKKLVELADEISKFTTDTNIYTKLSKYNEFYDLYNKMISIVKASKWVEAKKLEIEKPYEAQDNQKYILWLKDENGEIDFQILTAYKKTVTSVEEKEVQVEDASKLPVSFDETTNLYIALAIVVIAIIVMLVIRKNISNKDKRK